MYLKILFAVSILLSGHTIIQAQNNYTVSGHLACSNGNPMDHIELLLSNTNGTFMDTLITDASGNFAFTAVPGNMDYTLILHQPNSDLNGVSTLDLVLIQKYLLGEESFTPAYLFAADADSSGHVSIRDILILRGVILGIYTPNLPWHLSSVQQGPAVYLEINQLTADKTLRIEAIKRGDVNGTSCF